MNGIVIKFLQEAFQRLFTKSPLFFKICSIISGTLLLITGLPDFIALLNINGFHIPNLWNVEVTKAVKYASSGLLFMSLLTSQSTPIGKTVGGNIIKVTDTSKLPFT